MKRNFIFIIIFLLLSSVVFLIQKSVYDNKIRLVNSELSKLREENKFINELNDKLLNNNNPIDKKEQECLNKAFSTSDTLQCCNIALEEWEKETEKYLSLLKESMSDEQYKHIQNNQDLWKKQNKNNNDIITEFVFNHGGTMYYQVAYDYYVQNQKQRAEFLKSIYEIHNNVL